MVEDFNFSLFFFQPPMAQARFWNNDENWPTIYDIGFASNGRISSNGGIYITISGKNFASSLVSFGDAEGSDVSIFLLRGLV